MIVALSCDENNSVFAAINGASVMFCLTADTARASSFDSTCQWWFSLSDRNI